MSEISFDSFFDKIYCINLDDRPDRWDLAQKEFESVGIKNYVRFSAIKNTERGAFGCRDSHVAVIRDAKMNDYKRILILEDDFNFINKDQDLFKKVLEQIGTINYDIFYLGATVERNMGRFRKITENIVNTNFAFTTHAYSITSRLYDKILNEAPHFPIIDVYYQTGVVPFGNCYISNPMVCLQRSTYSDIEKRYVDYHWMVDFFNEVKNKSNIS